MERNVSLRGSLCALLAMALLGLLCVEGSVLPEVYAVESRNVAPSEQRRWIDEGYDERIFTEQPLPSEPLTESPMDSPTESPMTAPARELPPTFVATEAPAPTPSPAPVIQGMPVVDDSEDEVAPIEHDEFEIEGNVTTFISYDEEVVVTAVDNTMPKVPIQKIQYEVLDPMCSLMMDYDASRCFSREMARQDVKTLTHMLVRKGLSEAQVDAYLMEHFARLRNSWKFDAPKAVFNVQSSDYVDCMDDTDAVVLGRLLAAMAEDYPPSRYRELRENSWTRNLARNSSLCCHRVCNALLPTKLNMNLMYDTCCMNAPSKCANFY
ncbi:hypothetical protein FVE85_3246 [Porphyridium purpureum]|uniref:Uncharacterized protein n=1 Tax=Porphyridium purpureum TaxID=35688 RepID=A0A5J4YUS2_PORPP|nr:hypothetical protein FVE85_3246 [Porphyridium purpureum]|eukprot:POR5171..scf227_4